MARAGEVRRTGSQTLAKAAITTCTMRFNTLKGIETTEREDLGEATDTS